MKSHPPPHPTRGLCNHVFIPKQGNTVNAWNELHRVSGSEVDRPGLLSRIYRLGLSASLDSPKSQWLTCAAGTVITSPRQVQASGRLSMDESREAEASRPGWNCTRDVSAARPGLAR